MFAKILKNGRALADDDLPGSANGLHASDPAASEEAVCDSFRNLTLSLVVAALLGATALAVTVHARVDPNGSSVLDCLLALFLFLSRKWWSREGYQRIADVLGTFSMAALGGMACGAIAMLELRLHVTLADAMLRSWDERLGIDAIAVLEWQVRDVRWMFALMAPAYNYTLQIFFGGLILLSLLKDRIEAWRAAFCFVGTLFTTCLIAAAFPAKGLGVWASPQLLGEMPTHAMRSFWEHFDTFYLGADPVLKLQVVDGVVCFPSFHAIVGFITLAMWWRNVWTRLAAASYLSVMLLSTLPGGGHYVVDLIGGLFVWAAWFLWSRAIEKRVAIRQPPALWRLGNSPGAALSSAGN